MKRIYTYLVAAVFVVGVLVLILKTGTVPAMAQAPACHDHVIGKPAVGLARAINTAQIRSFQTKTLYQPLSALGVTVPAGLDVQLVSSPTSYVFSVKDTQEACRFTLFSDQEGLIYVARPLQ